MGFRIAEENALFYSLTLTVALFDSDLYKSAAVDTVDTIDAVNFQKAAIFIKPKIVGVS